MRSAFALLASIAAVGTMAWETELTANSVTGLCDTVDQEAGYLTIKEKSNVKYFYWYFESRNEPSTDPLFFWMTGGPGCASSLAIMTENGPCQPTADGESTTTNPYSWNAKANAIWIDQPAAVGFSTGDISGWDRNETMVSNDMYTFLQEFFKAHPELQGRELYVFGESYGGHYVPATAHRIFEGNKNGDGMHINLKGIGVGNGMTVPTVQFDYYPQLAYNFSIALQGHPTVSYQTYKQMTDALGKCDEMSTQCQKDVSVCASARTFCSNAEIGPYQATGLNVYNIREPCVVPGLCYNFTDVSTFYNKPSTQQALGVNKKWTSCNMWVNAGFNSDWMRDFDIPYVTDLLANDIRVLIYAGNLDFICNWLGNQAWTLELDWPGQEGFNNAVPHSWGTNSTGQPGGLARTYGGLTFMQVYEAGHLVPMDQPKFAQEMFNNFVSGGTF